MIVRDVEKPAFKALVFAICGYECVALASLGRVPTLSELSNRANLRWIGPVLVGGLATHIWRYGRVRPVIIEEICGDL